MVRESPHPVVAIGGIHAENVADVARVGAAAAAVISAVADAPDPGAALRVLQERFHEGREARARSVEEPT